MREIVISLTVTTLSTRSQRERERKKERERERKRKGLHGLAHKACNESPNPISKCYLNKQQRLSLFDILNKYNIIMYMGKCYKDDLYWFLMCFL